MAVTSSDFSFDVHIRTIIAGTYSWDVPWIVFDYINEDNYYYVVFHTDGVLELSQKIDDQYSRYVSFVKTQLTPFQWNTFHIVLNETMVTVRLDGEYQVSTPRRLEADTSSVIISPTMPDPSGIWIACIYSININVRIHHRARVSFHSLETLSSTIRSLEPIISSMTNPFFTPFTTSLVTGTVQANLKSGFLTLLLVNRKDSF